MDTLVEPLFLDPCYENSWAGLMLMALDITILFRASVATISLAACEVAVFLNIILFFLVIPIELGSFLGELPSVVVPVGKSRGFSCWVELVGFFTGGAWQKEPSLDPEPFCLNLSLRALLLEDNVC
jgi:hypothetical protein